MNITRMAILGVAAIAAGAAALLVRNGMNSRTPAAPTAVVQAVTTADVLVASKEVAPGRALTADMVRWQPWPKAGIPLSVIARTAQPDIVKAIDGMVTRTPLIAGQPITDTEIVHTKAVGFMAANIMSGMRGISIPIAEETGAGGFILPNDRVDVVLTRDVTKGGSTAKNFQSETVLTDVRVLAISQTSHQDKDQQTVIGKTATLELTPEQAEALSQAEQTSRAENTGGLALALRPLGESDGAPQMKPVVQRALIARNPRPRIGPVVVYRYGIVRGDKAGDNIPAPEPPSAEPANPQNPGAGPVAMETPR
jgi:pilus assembly protein CpaB